MGYGKQVCIKFYNTVSWSHDGHTGYITLMQTVHFTVIDLKSDLVNLLRTVDKIFHFP